MAAVEGGVRLTITECVVLRIVSQVWLGQPDSPETIGELIADGHVVPAL